MMPKGVYRRPWQPEPPPKRTLTVDLARASHVRDPATGRAFPRNSEVFARCLRLLKR